MVNFIRDAHCQRPACLLTFEPRCELQQALGSTRLHSAPLEIDARDRGGSSARPPPSYDLVGLCYTRSQVCYLDACSVTADSDHSPACGTASSTPLLSRKLRSTCRRLPRTGTAQTHGSSRGSSSRRCWSLGIRATCFCGAPLPLTPAAGSSLTTDPRRRRPHTQPSHLSRGRSLLVLETLCTVCQDRPDLQSGGVRGQ